MKKSIEKVDSKINDERINELDEWKQEILNGCIDIKYPPHMKEEIIKIILPLS